MVSLAVAGCGGEAPGASAGRPGLFEPFVTSDERLPDGVLRRSILTRRYRLRPWRVGIHAEPLRLKPFSDSERVWIIRWWSNTENAAGEREPDDIH